MTFFAECKPVGADRIIYDLLTMNRRDFKSESMGKFTRMTGHSVAIVCRTANLCYSAGQVFRLAMTSFTPGWTGEICINMRPTGGRYSRPCRVFSRTRVNCYRGAGIAFAASP
jgi:hypothetical protein